MGVGQDKVSAEVFNIEPTAIIDFFRIYPDTVNNPKTYFNVHNGSVFGVGVTWQGEDYMPMAMEYEGFETTADGRPNRPLVRFANSQYFVSSLLEKYDDFSNGKIERKRTFVKFLDDTNFDGGNPWGESDPSAEISNDSYIISQKKRENKNFVELELTNPLDFESYEINHRRVMGRYCYWKYRGPGCQYSGPPVEKNDRQPFTGYNNQKLLPSDVSSKAKTNGNSYLGDELFLYADGRDVYLDNKRYYRGNIVFKINTRVRIQDEQDPNIFKPLLVYYVAKFSTIDGVDNIGKDPEKHPEYWDEDGCRKTVGACQSHFKNISLVDIPREALIYSQSYFRILQAAKTHMGFLQPPNGYESIFNWATGDGYKSGRKKEFTMVIHYNETKPSIYQGTDFSNESPEWANIFSADAKTSSNGFRLSMSNVDGYGDLVINCRERVSSTKRAYVEFYPLREGGVKEGTKFLQNLDVNLQSCKDLLIIIKMKLNPASYKKSFEIEVSGINSGQLLQDPADVPEGEEPEVLPGTTGEEKSFKIKNTFDTNKTLSSSARRLVWIGGPTRRNSEGIPPKKPFNWSHNECNLAGILLFNKNIPNNLLKEFFADRSYTDQLKTKILRKPEDINQDPQIKQTLLKDCKAYWSSPEAAGLQNAKDPSKPLSFKSTKSQKVSLAGTAFFDRTSWTKPQVLLPFYGDRLEVENNVNASFKTVFQSPRDVGVLPFGGFPGTDGYDFRSS